ncbi:MAG: hypothetical protein KF746_23840 [Chitinophagaceae bacterium]|nr:hypothetical protein [Chitinophagaceae bacterium]
MKQFLPVYILFGFLLLSKAANAQAPLNDECSSAVLITPVPFSAGCVSTVHGTTAGATRSLLHYRGEQR